MLVKKRVSYLAKEGGIVEHLSNLGIVFHNLSCLGIGHHDSAEHFWVGHHVLFLKRTKQSQGMRMTTNLCSLHRFVHLVGRKVRSLL